MRISFDPGDYFEFRRDNKEGCGVVIDDSMAITFFRKSRSQVVVAREPIPPEASPVASSLDFSYALALATVKVTLGLSDSLVLG